DALGGQAYGEIGAGFLRQEDPCRKQRREEEDAVKRSAAHEGLRGLDRSRGRCLDERPRSGSARAVRAAAAPWYRSSAMAKADYGIDAPPVVTGLLLGGILSIAVSVWGRIGGPGVARFLLWPGIAWMITGVWMVLGSKVLKLRARDRLLDALS